MREKNGGGKESLKSNRESKTVAFRQGGDGLKLLGGRL